VKKLYTEMTEANWKSISCCGEVDVVHVDGTIHHYVCRECGRTLGTLDNGDTPVVTWDPNTANNIRQARRLANLTQTELAEKSGIDQRQISRYEQGQDMAVSSLIRIARALGIEPGELLK